MPYVYRCNACRTRNTFLKPWLAYVRGRSCRHCGHTRFYVDKERAGRVACRCAGYHYPHRPGSGACDHSPRREIYNAKRGGDAAEIAEAVLEHAMKHGGELTSVCPF